MAAVQNIPLGNVVDAIQAFPTPQPLLGPLQALASSAPLQIQAIQSAANSQISAISAASNSQILVIQGAANNLVTAVNNIPTPQPLLAPVQILASSAPLQIQAIQGAENGIRDEIYSSAVGINNQIYQSQQAVTQEIYGSSEMIRSQIEHAEGAANELHRQSGGFFAELGRLIIAVPCKIILWIIKIISVSICWLMAQIVGFLPTMAIDSIVIPSDILPYMAFFFPVDVFAKCAVLLAAAFSIMWIWGFVQKWVATL
jgi:hypothetical protein